MKNSLIIFTMLLCGIFVTNAQELITDSISMDYTLPKEYEVGGITFSGADNHDQDILIFLTGISVGETITVPGEQIAKSIKNLWRQGLFTDIQVNATKIIGSDIFLEYAVVEKPRLSRQVYRGIKKSEAEDLRKKMALIKGRVVTENVKRTARRQVLDYYVKKGYQNSNVVLKEEIDTTLANHVKLVFEIDRGSRVKISDIQFTGNDNIKSSKLSKVMSGSKKKGITRIFSVSKFDEESYKQDKKTIVSLYNQEGYRDARVANDEVIQDSKGDYILKLDIEENNQYYFGDISFSGNVKYDDNDLERILNIKKGEVYDPLKLETGLYLNQNGPDVTSLYMDDGYLFFSINPVETGIIGDSISMEVKITEGPQATIDKVIINGNTKTNEHVIRRELRTKPGQKFSRSDVIRSQREIINLGYFDPEQLNVIPKPNPEKGTVDIEYTVVEKPSDQVELSAGWGGAGRGVVGTFGLNFTNFSLRNIKDPSTWSPLPSGDGQTFSMRVQTNGRFSENYSLSFTEPWLGGKKPTSFSVSGYLSNLRTNISRDSEFFGSLRTVGATIGLGTRLKWPDDFFTSLTAFNYQYFELNNWSSSTLPLPFRDGRSNIISLKQTFARSSVDHPLFPTSGSNFELSVQATPPWSSFNDKDYSDPELSDDERYELVEFHKWKIKAEWYSRMKGKFVLKTSAKMGYLGLYNNDIGLSPFERFYVGGDGVSNVSTYGSEIISHRGYDATQTSAGAFGKYVVELRYPVSTNPNSTIFLLSFYEGANQWRTINEINPFDLKQSAGLGLRVFLPMFGLLGFDYGIGFDNLQSGDTFSDALNKGTFNIILGFEPE